MRRILVSVVIVTLLLGGGRACAETDAAESLSRWFTLEWQVTRSPRGPVIEGYVYNKTNRGVFRMLLGVERLDGAGHVVGRSTVWVSGVPPGNRAFFQAKTAEATGYRVQVLNFDWVGRGGL
jgi:hypothetical protein